MAIYLLKKNFTTKKVGVSKITSVLGNAYVSAKIGEDVYYGLGAEFPGNSIADYAQSMADAIVSSNFTFD